MMYVGIDIGKSGAVVCLEDNSFSTFVTPKIGTEIDQHKLAKHLEELCVGADVIVVAEDVHSIFGAGAKSNFQFGRSLGIVEGILCALKIRFEKVAPKTWQKVSLLGVPLMQKTSKTTKSGKSNDTKAMALLAAQRLYPHIDLRKSERAKVPHDGVVDALLMAHYAKIKYPRI